MEPANTGYNKIKTLILHPDINAGGGAELFCLRFIEALKMLKAAGREFDITVLHCGRSPDVGVIRRAFGSASLFDDIKFITPGKLWSRIGDTKRLALLKYAAVLRHAGRMAKDYAFVVSTFGESPVEAGRSIQCILTPLFLTDRKALNYLGVFHGKYDARYILRLLYVLLCRGVAGWEKKKIRDKTTIVISDWTGEAAKEGYGILKTLCVYPGAEVGIKPGSPDWVDFKDRENGFVMLGRLHKNKRIETGIEILEGLRERGHDVHLHIIGNVQGGYARRLRKHISGKSFVSLHENMSRDDMERLVVGHKFGLHTYMYEHFGIAVAEMQMLGCLTFVPDFGGQKEVVRNPAQRYSTAREAVMKIENVIKSEGFAERLLGEARETDKLLTVRAFKERCGEIVLNEIEGNGGSHEKP